MPDSLRIGALYGSFVARLPPELRSAGAELPFRLGLVPRPSITWSQAFKHAVTLQAPELLIDGTSGVDARLVDRAVLAHLLAVIEAFGADRVADGQVTASLELAAVLEQVRLARDEALFELYGEPAVELASDADRRTHQAIVSEQQRFGEDDPVPFSLYEAISSGKQAVGLTAGVALGKALGWRADRTELVRSTLMNIALGLQFQDDVVDWEADFVRGGAWALLLARHELDNASKPVDLAEARALVLSSGVLAELLMSSETAYRNARLGAEELGAVALAHWADEREREARDFHENERKTPGFLLRLKQLGPWAAEVFG